MIIQTVIHIIAKNDVNGNPRRAFIISEINTEDPLPYPFMVDVIDEGYGGRNAYLEHYPKAMLGGIAIETTPREYKKYLKIGETLREAQVLKDVLS